MESDGTVAVPSPVCAATLRTHAFRYRPADDRELRCLDCGVTMPEAAVLRDGPDARHCAVCGWWSADADAARSIACVWCKSALEP